MTKILAIFVLVLLFAASGIAVPGVLAQSTSVDDDEVNRPGGIMSATGLQHHPQSPGPSHPLDVKAHPPAHIKKFIGPSAVSLSGGYGPQTIWTAYGLSSLGCTYATTTDWTDPALCGHGQTIAIVDAYDDPSIESDLQTFDAQFGLPTCTSADGCFVKSAPHGIKTNSGWALEMSLDVEWAHSVAPGARIVLVEAASNSLGNLLGGVSTAVGTGAKQVSNSWGSNEFSSETSYDSYFESPTASFFVASGDGGNGVEWPAASPYVIAVGGTTLEVGTSGQWSGETAWSGSSGGLSAFEPKPSYQNFLGGSQRAVPDVSYDGDPNTGVYVYDSVKINGQSGWWLVGGTSAGAPQWAGISAIANSQGARLSSASFGTSNALYGAASGSQSSPQTDPYLTNYHDVVSGSNGACGSVCNAGSGYDEVTGLGSPQANNLVPYLVPSPKPDFSISASPSSLTVEAGGTNSSTITVTSLNGFAGNVTLSVSPSAGTSLGSSTLLIGTAGGSASTMLSLTPSSSATYSVTGTSGLLSHSTSISVEVEAVPSAPQNLQASAGDRQASLSWQAPSSTGGLPVTYDVFRNGTQEASGITSTGYADTGLVNGETYVFYVTAVNSMGQSVPSNAVSVIPQSSPSLLVSVTTNQGSYTKGSDAAVTVHVSDQSGVPVQSASVSVSVSSPDGSTSTHTGLTNGSGNVSYNYKISKHAHPGTYIVTATATKSGYVSGSSTITFDVTNAVAKK